MTLVEAESQEHKVKLNRMSAMLNQLSERSYCVKENSENYGFEQIEFGPDSDSDFDPEEI